MNDIQIKGIGDGLLLQLGEEVTLLPYEEVVAQIVDRLKMQGAFFKGSRVAFDVGQYPLLEWQIQEIQQLLVEYEMELWAVLGQTVATRDAARQLGLAIRLPGSNTDLDGNQLESTFNEVEKKGEGYWPPESMALFLRETIRSGRSIYYEGNIVLIGDVNPGGELIATGDVIVWGRLRGVVHAGAEGDEKAIICALELMPTQLRIAHHIAVAPADRRDVPLPEKAVVKNNQIVADVWMKRF